MGNNINILSHCHLYKTRETYSLVIPMKITCVNGGTQNKRNANS